MAKIGLAYPCWAKVDTEPTSALPTYNTGLALGKATKADLAIEYAEGQLYADNVIAEDVSEFLRGTIALETDTLAMTTMGTIYGATINDGELANDTEDSPPYGGFAYYQVLMVNGVRKYRTFFYPKVKAKMGDESNATKGSGFVFGVTPITLTVFKPAFGAWRYVKEHATESAAKAYIDTKLGVATWYPVNVMVTGAGIGEGASPKGTTMVASGGTFELVITGTCDALYDNGVDESSSIAAGKYTLTNVTAAHDIAVVFTPA